MWTEVFPLLPRQVAYTRIGEEVSQSHKNLENNEMFRLQLLVDCTQISSKQLSLVLTVSLYWIGDLCLTDEI
jgi:hypothetical protein